MVYNTFRNSIFHATHVEHGPFHNLLYSNTIFGSPPHNSICEILQYSCDKAFPQTIFALTYALFIYTQDESYNIRNTNSNRMNQKIACYFEIFLKKNLILTEIFAPRYICCVCRLDNPFKFAITLPQRTAKKEETYFLVSAYVLFSTKPFSRRNKQAAIRYKSEKCGRIYSDFDISK